MAFAPDPSINHNIASKAHHDGTAQWFFQGSIFKKWNPLIPSCGYMENVRTPGLHHATAPDHLLYLAGSGKSVLWFALRLIPLL